ncbi:hypothetical protein [Streptomyces olivaceoviridis]|uniref:hypothetical protein n=1 Tax=Streptomyces olivaceoviridis TaxID=1921 RepID=UPI00024BCD55|nr:hypothetical protein SHJG_0807 [Streptomyces hygroscopicus subsp. jinggangensis 5008]AGF60306.1 hypothetical protein SHJGH_0640 [Streptomyces hygroscopicus subsp. jinggangensis TL01]
MSKRPRDGDIVHIGAAERLRLAYGTPVLTHEREVSLTRTAAPDGCAPAWWRSACSA